MGKSLGREPPGGRCGRTCARSGRHPHHQDTDQCTEQRAEQHTHRRATSAPIRTLISAPSPEQINAQLRARTRARIRAQISAVGSPGTGTGAGGRHGNGIDGCRSHRGATRYVPTSCRCPIRPSYPNRRCGRKSRRSPCPRRRNHPWQPRHRGFRTRCRRSHRHRFRTHRPLHHRWSPRTHRTRKSRTRNRRIHGSPSGRTPNL